jgi:hypothetical protein
VAARIALIKLKIERAKKHICDLGREKAIFLDPNPYVVTGEYYSEHNATIYFLDHPASIPDSVRLIAGDAAHNLRTALDHLACLLVEANGGIVSNSTAFPICESLAKYEIESGRKTEGMRQEARDAIKRTAPYRGGNDTIWGLHELDRIDKHRLLITVASIIHKFGFEVGVKELEEMLPGFRFNPKDFPRTTAWFDPLDRKFGAEKGDPIFTITGNYEADKNVKFAFDIALGEPEVFKGRPLVETLSTAAETIDNLVSDFMPFLL